MLYVDCEQSTTAFLQPRGPIDTNGEITVSKLANTKQTVPVCTLIKYYTIYSTVKYFKRFPKPYLLNLIWETSTNVL